jgi:hypothetical protein
MIRLSSGRYLPELTCSEYRSLRLTCPLASHVVVHPLLLRTCVGINGLAIHSWLLPSYREPMSVVQKHFCYGCRLPDSPSLVIVRVTYQHRIGQIPLTFNLSQ